MLRAENITYRAGRKHIVKDCSVAISPGSFTAVVGPNGAGKTSLLKAISHEVTWYSGSVFLNGKNISTLKTRELSTLRAVLPQHTTVNFPFTIEQVIEIGRYPHLATKVINEKVIAEVMELTNLTKFTGRIYQTLSGGEQQRVQMARVMAQLWGASDAPKYLLLDEPTSSLDLAQQHILLGLAKELCNRGIGVLAILHDLNLASQYADEVLFLKEGETIAYGPTLEVMTSSVIEETFSHPVEVTYDKWTARPKVYARSSIHPSIHEQQVTHKHNAYEHNNHR
jgi:iron complex transport system ATP-binding protein